MMKIRRMTKKYRKILMAVVVLIVLGLVGSFGAMNLSGFGVQDGGFQPDEFMMESQISSWLGYIRTLEENATEFTDFLNLANSYMELSYMYAELYSANEEEPNEELIEAVQSSAGWSRHYFQRAADNAPEDISSMALADIRAGQAEACDLQGDMDGAFTYMQMAYNLQPEEMRFVYAMALLSQAMENVDDARRYFLEARALDPEDIYVVDAFANFLFFAESPDAGLSELYAYRATLPTGHPYIEMVEESIEYLLSWAELMASLETDFEFEGEDDFDWEGFIEDELNLDPSNETVDDEIPQQ